MGVYYRTFNFFDFSPLILLPVCRIKVSEPIFRQFILKFAEKHEENETYKFQVCGFRPIAQRGSTTALLDGSFEHFP